MEDKYAQKSERGNNVNPNKHTNKQVLTRGVRERAEKPWIYTACGRGEESDRCKVGGAWRNAGDDLIQFQNLHVMRRVHRGYKGCSF